MDKNSMLYWYPLVCGLDVPQPRTRIVEMSLYSDSLSRPVNVHLKEIRQATKELGGYPVFMRTDLMSAKLDWYRTCYCKSEQNLIANIPYLVEFSETCDVMGRPVSALVFREYVEMDSTFRAFNNLPISRERRYFMLNGEVQCHHPYWPEAAIKFNTHEYTEEFYSKKYLGNWMQLLRALNRENTEEIELLTNYAKKVSSILSGYWSVDFCKSRRYGWYFIDCALGENSWHPECSA